MNGHFESVVAECWTAILECWTAILDPAFRLTFRVSPMKILCNRRQIYVVERFTTKITTSYLIPRG
jgi:hypothetical protein